MKNYTLCASRNGVGTGRMAAARGSGIETTASIDGLPKITVSSSMIWRPTQVKPPEIPLFPSTFLSDGSVIAPTTALLASPWMVACTIHPDQYYS